MRYEKYKQTGIPWLPEIPQEWNVVPFKGLYGFGKGLPITKEHLREAGVPVVSYGQIHSKINTGTTLKAELLRHVSEEYLLGFESCLLRYGDMAIADTSEDEEGCGNSVLMDRKENVFAGYHTIIARIKNCEYAHFLALVFQCADWRSQLRNLVHGVKVFSITKRILATTRFPLPPLPTQRAIVAYLDDKCGKIDELVAAKEKEVELLKELKQTVIADAVTRGVEDGRVEGERWREKSLSTSTSLHGKNTRRLVPSGIPWLPQIPEGWEVKRLKCLFTMRDERYSSKEALRVLSLLKDVGVIPYEEKGAVGNKSKDDISQYKVARVGDIVMNSMNVIIGSVDISPYDGYISPAYYALTAREEVCVKYYNFIFHLSSVQKSMRSLAKGIMEIRLRISPTSLFGMYYPVPPLDEQRAIVAYIEEKAAKIDQAVAGLAQQVAALKEYKQRLIADVVTGQMRVA